eukprot:TRINITY_DN1037_c0_g1_i4.p2 TRINITY_DN1037_c0_g1~~TRINITY_DN1037_c0_g1_i4.p2  ORF type:complete len:150 (-),score=23.23 TRINITY_DN1037_c0_g1_i4:667-1116(-)
MNTVICTLLLSLLNLIALWQHNRKLKRTACSLLFSTTAHIIQDERRLLFPKLHKWEKKLEHKLQRKSNILRRFQRFNILRNIEVIQFPMNEDWYEKTGVFEDDFEVMLKALKSKLKRPRWNQKYLLRIWKENMKVFQHTSLQDLVLRLF